MRVFQRYECILAIEGDYDVAVLNSRLRDYKNKALPEPPFSLELVLLTRKPGDVIVCNGLAHVSQRLLGAYKVTGVLQEEGLAQLKGDYIIDFAGRAVVSPGSDGSWLLSMQGTGSKQVANGDIILVEERDSDEPVCTSFAFFYRGTRPQNVSIDPSRELFIAQDIGEVQAMAESLGVPLTYVNDIPSLVDMAASLNDAELARFLSEGELKSWWKGLHPREKRRVLKSFRELLKRRSAVRNN